MSGIHEICVRWKRVWLFGMWLLWVETLFIFRHSKVTWCHSCMHEKFRSWLYFLSAWFQSLKIVKVLPPEFTNSRFIEIRFCLFLFFKKGFWYRKSRFFKVLLLCLILTDKNLIYRVTVKLILNTIFTEIKLWTWPSLWFIRKPKSKTFLSDKFSYQ